MSKQTAVEWLFSQLPDHLRLTQNGFDLLNQAKEMEREQKESGNKTPNQSLFNYLSELGLTAIDTELHEITLIVAKELGIDSPDPKKWVEEMKTSFTPIAKGIIELQEKNSKLQAENEKLNKAFDVWFAKRISLELDRNILTNLQAENEKLTNQLDDLQRNYEKEYRDSGFYQAENEKLKEGLNIFLSSIEGSLSGIEDFKGDSDVVGISEVTNMLNDIFKQINDLIK